MIERVIEQQKQKTAKEICDAILEHAVRKDDHLRQIDEPGRIDDKTVFIVCKSWARSSFSGAIDGRPPSAYMASNKGDIEFRISSVMARTARSGWSFRTRCSGDK